MSPKGKPTKPICVYTRVSEKGKRSDEELLSHDLQRAKVQKYLDARDMIASPEVFEDTDKSGGKMSRPAFDRAIEGVLVGRYGGIAVAHLSRFGRTTSGVLDLITKIEEADGAVIILDPQLDTSTATGRAMLTVFLAFVTLEREQAVEKSADLAEKKLSEGTSLGGWAPVGYSYEVVGQDTNGKDRVGWLVPNEDAPVVLAAFEKFAAGASLGQVADFLNDAGVRTSRGNPWRISNVKGLLTRESYAGVRIRGDYRQEGAHEAIVPRALWRRVQKRLAPTGDRRSPGEGHVLGEGLVRCGVCRSGLVRGNNSKTDLLRCLTRGGGHPAIAYPKAEKFVVESVFERIGYRQAEVTVGRNGGEFEAAEARLAGARADLEEVEVARGSMSPVSFGLAHSDALAQVEAAEDAVEAATPRVEGSVIPWHSSPEILRPAFEKLSVPDKRRFLRECIERVVLTKDKGSAADRLRIEWVEGFEQGPTEPPKLTRAERRKILKGLGVPESEIL